MAAAATAALLPALLPALLLAAGAWRPAEAGLPLPPFLTKCPSAERQQLNACALQQAKAALPNIIDGVRKYGILRIDPLMVPKVVMDQPGLQLTLSNITMLGLRGAQVHDVDVDLRAKRLSFEFFNPKFTVLSQYSAVGRILLFTVRGNGDSTVTLYNSTCRYTAEFDVKEGEDGEQHAQITNDDFVYNITRAAYNFTNLFNGDERLGKVTNQFLNENWEEVSEDTKPATAELCRVIFTTTIQGVFDVVDYRDLFPQ